MAGRNMPRYYLVQAEALPEIFLRVMEAKELLQSGECATVGDAVNRVGISRSAFYKYKDAISPFQDLKQGRILTFQMLLRDRTGLLAKADGRKILENLKNYPMDQFSMRRDGN